MLTLFEFSFLCKKKKKKNFACTWKDIFLQGDETYLVYNLDGLYCKSPLSVHFHVISHNRYLYVKLLKYSDFLN